jgi:GAF domain-containing protein
LLDVLARQAADLIERRMAEVALRASEERQAFLLKLSDALRPLADPVAVQAVACRVLGEHLGVDRAYYVEMDETLGEARVRRDYLRGDSLSMAGLYRLADYGWSLPIMRAGETIVFADVARTDLVPAA